MIDAAWCALMADYNGWMNERLYAVCADLDDAERRRDRGAFFGSVHGTLNHILYADLAFMSRFTGDPPRPPELGVELHADFAGLRREREGLDARIRAWSAGLAPQWLDGSLTYVSKVDGASRTVPRWVLVTHMFNHATHHRGQVTTLLSQQGVDVGVTDIPFMARFDQRQDPARSLF